MICSAGEPELLVSALEYDRGGPCAVVSLSGQAGIADSGWIRPMLELHAAQGQGRLVIDLSRLSSMNWWVALMLAWAGRVVTRRTGGRRTEGRRTEARRTERRRITGRRPRRRNHPGS